MPDPTPPAFPTPPEEVRPFEPELEPELLVEELEQTRHDPYAALRSPNYRLFAAGFIFSGAGLNMLSVAIGWEVYERTNDPLALGLIGFCRALPVIFLALPAGHALDLYSRKWLLAATQATFALLAAALAAASWHHLPMWVYYVLVVLMGCTRSFNGPSRQSILPLIVPAKDFHNAVTWNSGVFQFTAMVGPIAAGVMLSSYHAAWPVYLVTAAGCLLFAVSSSFLRLNQPPRAEGSRFTLASMLAGLGHLWHEKTILATIALDLFAVLFGGATALMPVYARDILHAGPVGLGALRAAPYLGALVCALFLAHRPPFRRAGLAMLLSVAGFGVATIAFGLSRSFPLSLGVLMVLGALDNVSVVVRHVLVQVRTPDHIRGRVAAVNSIFIESSNELGAFESGAVARAFGGGAFGATASVVVGGIGTILVVLGVARLWPQVRRLGRLEMPKEG